MTVTAKQLANLKPIQKGQVLNPGGKPVGSRNRIQGDFLRRLADDFERFGIYAIARTRRHRPWEYLKVVASLMPKELEINKGLNELTDEQLNAALIAARALLAAADTGAGVIEASATEQTQAIPAISKAD